MLDALIRWSLDNRPLVLVLAAGCLTWGGLTVVSLPIDVLPDLTAPTVTVIAEYPGMAPTEMERLVTLPIEVAASAVPGVRRVRSSTAVGASVVWVEFEWGEDVYRARQLVAERLSGLTADLPAGGSRPTLGPVSSYMGEILFVGLTSTTLSPLEARAVAEADIRRRLLAVPGVAQVTVIGGARRQYQVLVSPEALAAHGVSVSEVREALAASNANSSAGFLVRGGREFLIHGVGRLASLDDIRRTVIRARGTVPIRIEDVATVRIGEALKRGEASVNGAEAVIIGIRKQPHFNTLALTESVDRALAELKPDLPPGLEVHADLFRQADFIEVAVSNLNEALLYGGLLVVASVLAFLANARASAITLLAIPFSMVGASLALAALGQSINVMTIGGLAIALGELVDDAVIDVENIVRRIRLNASLPESERRPVLEVVYRASVEIRRPVVFATVVVGLVFAPLLFLGGLEGRLLRPLGIAYLAAIFSSLVVALTITPVLGSLLLRRGRPARDDEQPALVRVLKRAYRPALGWGLRHSTAVMAVSGVAVAVAVASLGWAGRSFLPEFRETSLTVSAVTLPGTSLDESDRLGTAIERILLGVPEVESTGRRTGRGEGDEHIQGVESSEIDVRLRPSERSREAILADIRERLGLIPGTSFDVGQPVSHRIDHMLSGTRSVIAVNVFGDDLPTLRAIASQVEHAMESVPGVVDLSAEQQAEIPTVSVRFDRDALSRHGLPAGTATQALKTVFLGTEVSSIREPRVSVPLVVRYRGDRPDHIETIRQAMVDTPAGARVPLSAIAAIRESRSPNFISREGIRRKIAVSCNVAGRDLVGVVEDIQQRLREQVELPSGYRIEYGGRYASTERATRRIVLVGGLVIAGIGVLLVTAFRSVRDALVVMLNLPLALVGGVVGLFLSGGILTVASLIGFITLFGVATRNGILLVSHVKHLQVHEGVTSFREAIVRGAAERLAPILMTAVSTGLALVPIAMSMAEPGGEFHGPLAMVVVCGLFTATALNMLAVPAVYLRFGRPAEPAGSARSGHSLHVE